MTPEMLAKSRQIAARMGCRNVDFREGYAEKLPVEDGWGRRDQQRRHQPVRGQARDVQGDLSRLAPRWPGIAAPGR
jgi:hypothetical protein